MACLVRFGQEKWDGESMIMLAREEDHNQQVLHPCTFLLFCQIWEHECAWELLGLGHLGKDKNGMYDRNATCLVIWSKKWKVWLKYDFTSSSNMAMMPTWHKYNLVCAQPKPTNFIPMERGKIEEHFSCWRKLEMKPLKLPKIVMNLLANSDLKHLENFLSVGHLMNSKHQSSNDHNLNHDAPNATNLVSP